MNGQDRYDDLQQHLEDLFAEQHPRGMEPTAPDDLDLIKMAGLLRGGRADAPGPRPEFLAALAQRLEDEVRPAERAESPERRRLLLGGLAGAAASFLAGIGIDRAVNAPGSLPSPIPPAPDPELVGTSGHWFPICNAEDVPPGGGLRFRAGAIEGFVSNRGGEFQAHSAVCTHMGCLLSYRDDQSDLFCPCHGALYATDGTVKRGRAVLKSLPSLRTKVDGNSVFVWCVDDVQPSTAG